MTEQRQKTIGIVLIDGFADWEFGLLAGGAAEHFGAKVVFMSPDGKPVKSIGGLEARPARRISPDENEDLDAVALIGSDTWTGDAAPDIVPLISLIRAMGGVSAAYARRRWRLPREDLWRGCVTPATARIGSMAMQAFIPAPDCIRTFHAPSATARL